MIAAVVAPAVLERQQPAPDARARRGRLAAFAAGVPGAWPKARPLGVRRAPLGAPPQEHPRARAACSAYRGWKRLNDRRSWDFLLGSSPFSYEEVVANVRREEYMDNLVWVEQVLGSDEQEPRAKGEGGGAAGGSAAYPDAFTAYLSRLLLSRDERCASWWAGATEVSEEPPELLFARFQASLAAALAQKWRGRAGALAASLIKRFGGRFPFDAERQIKLCFSLLPATMLRGSFFEQEFSTYRDELMEVFLVMDSDGNGVLSSEEIGSAFKSLGGWLSRQEIKGMLLDALANSDGEVDFAGFKSAIMASHEAARRRQAEGIPQTEWWRDPAALLPATLLDEASPEMLDDAHKFFEVLILRAQEEEEALRPQASASTSQALLLPRAPPLIRERPLRGAVYALFCVAGSFACTLTHVALVPIDVVKTLQQTEAERFGGLGLLGGCARLLREGGLRELFLGTLPTLAGYTWYGATVFPGYEFFKRRLLSLCGSRLGARLQVPLVLLSGALATFFACIGVCPAEAVRIRTVREHGFQASFLSPPGALFAGFAPLLFRQVFFGMAKFLVFDTFSSLVYRRCPGLARARRSALLVSLLSGALAGLVATFVSQPSDAILTRLALAPQLGMAGAAASLWAEGGVAAFFAGFLTRSVWAACIIAGQFLLYDVAKQVFRVTAEDLTQRADVLATALRTREPMPLNRPAER